MKNSILSLLLAVMTVGASAVFTSCKNEEKKEASTKNQISPKDAFLAEAKNGLNEYIKDKTHNPDAFKMSESNVVYLTDSACVIKFRFIAENRFGGHVNGKAQWIWFKYKGDFYQSWQDSTDDDIYEFGDNWIVEDEKIGALNMLLLCTEAAEQDSNAKKMFYKDNTFDMTNDYAKLYCIVMKTGEKVNPKRFNQKP